LLRENPFNGRANEDLEHSYAVTEEEEYVLGVALEQTLTTGVFSPYLHSFESATVKAKDWKQVLKSLDRKELLAHHGLTITGTRYIHFSHLANTTQLALIEHYKREVLRSILTIERGNGIKRGLPISVLVEQAPVSYAILMIAIAVLEIEAFIMIDRRRLITAGPSLNERLHRLNQS
jgi:hypothetical protein